MERMKKTKKMTKSHFVICSNTWKSFPLRRKPWNWINVKRKQSLKNCEWKMKTYTVASTVPFEFVSLSLMVFFYSKKKQHISNQSRIVLFPIIEKTYKCHTEEREKQWVPCMAEDLPIIRHATSEQELPFTSLNRFPTWLRLIRNIEKRQVCRPQFVIVFRGNPLGQRQTNIQTDKQDKGEKKYEKKTLAGK